MFDALNDGDGVDETPSRSSSEQSKLELHSAKLSLRFERRTATKKKIENASRQLSIAVSLIDRINARMHEMKKTRRKQRKMCILAFDAMARNETNVYTRLYALATISVQWVFATLQKHHYIASFAIKASRFGRLLCTHAAVFAAFNDYFFFCISFLLFSSSSFLLCYVLLLLFFSSHFSFPVARFSCSYFLIFPLCKLCAHQHSLAHT